MADSFTKLKELDLTREEVERIGEALKKEEFRKLLVDYVEEVQDPENKKLYQEEITQLEKERGVDVTFINPNPGYVIKSSVDGSRKCFINVCSNDNIGRPTSVSAKKEGSHGLQWSVPHCLAPPREDVDNKGVRCVVYDVVFHPDTLRMATKNKSFYSMVNTTACEAIEGNFEVTLDKKNLKFPKMQYKGLAHAAVIRKPVENFVAQPLEPEEKEFLDKLYPRTQADQPKKRPKKNSRSEEKLAAHTTPTYIIKHRSHIDIQEFVDDKNAKLNATIPRELIVEINLPLIRSSSDITLDVTEKTVQLLSEKPSKYKLNLTLPYRVNQDNGNAKFDKDLKKLIITLPVKRYFHDYGRDDSGVESDHGSPIMEPDQTSPVFSDCALRTSFLNETDHYDLPEFTCHLFENTLAFTLNVKNVDESSICKVVTSDSIHIKFTSVSSSYYLAHYAFFVKIPTNIQGAQVETWDNNVIVQVQLDNSIKNYYYGLTDTDLKEKFIEEPSIINSVLVLQNGAPPQKQDSSNPSNEFNTSGTSYESSGDELSSSYSPSKSKGILKRLSNRALVGRSISESSLDDYVCSSFDNESTIPEDGELSTSLKKTVRFSDVIMRQLYRSNSSILGQKKKNQRKSRNKKRAQERRHSESETSEIDDKKDEMLEKDEDDKSDQDKSDTNSDIFHMDMN